MRKRTKAIAKKRTKTIAKKRTKAIAKKRTKTIARSTVARPLGAGARQPKFKTLVEGVLQVCTYASRAPFFYRGKTGVRTGLDYMFLTKFAVRHNLQIHLIEEEGFDYIWNQPGKNVCDIAAGSISKDDINYFPKGGDVSDPYLEVKRSLLVRASDRGLFEDINSDLSKKTIVTIKGTIAEGDAKSRYSARDAKFMYVEQLLPPSPADCQARAVQRIKRHVVDAFAESDICNQHLLYTYDDDGDLALEDVHNLYNYDKSSDPKEQLVFVARKASEGLLEALNAFIKANKRLYALNLPFAPPTYQADPSVYKVVLEDQNYRVTRATWARGLTDKPHSHPVPAVAYALTDCAFELTPAGGAPVTAHRKAGDLAAIPVTASRTAKNIGAAECRAMAFERKGARQPKFKTLAAGKLTICTYAGFAPVCYRNKEGNLTGYDVNFLTAFAIQNSLQVEVIEKPFKDIWTLPGKNQCDIAGAGIMKQDKRPVVPGGSWSDPYFYVSRSLLVRKGEEAVFNNYQRLSGKTIIVTEKSTAESDARKRYPNCKILLVSAVAAGQKDPQGYIAGEIRKGTYDAFGEGDVSNQYLKDTYGNGNLALADVHYVNEGFPLSEPFNFITRDASSGLLEALNAFIAKNKLNYTSVPPFAPPAYRADPSVYKVVFENRNYRVVLATWPPGVTDKPHSHPLPAVAYALTDCDFELTSAEGKKTVTHPKAGALTSIPVTTLHTAKNIGSKECRTMFFEHK